MCVRACVRIRDLLAIGKFGTIPERPVQSRPAHIIYKIYFNYFIWLSVVPQGSVLVSFLSLWGKLFAENSRSISLGCAAL